MTFMNADVAFLAIIGAEGTGGAGALGGGACATGCGRTG